MGETTSAQGADNAVSNIYKRNSAVLCRNMVHCGTLCRAIPGGNRRADDIRPYADGATELPSGYFGAFVGADSIRPVVSPVGKQRRRNAPTMEPTTIHNVIRRYNFATLHRPTSSPHRGNTVLLINLPRWRADDIRPYADGATELPSGNFGAFVGEDIIFPVVSPMGETTSALCADNAMSNILQ